MMDASLIPWLLAGIPCLGALATLPFLSNPERLKWFSRRLGRDQPRLGRGIRRPDRSSA